MPYCKKCGNEIAVDAKFCPKCGTPTDLAVYGPPSGVGVAPSIATWGERFVAWLLDSIIVGIVVGILSLSTWIIWQPIPYLPQWNPFFNFGSGSLIFFLYWTVMDGLYGQSLGKMIMHLRVTKVDGSPIGIGHAALESFGKAFFLLLDFLIGLFLYPNKRQRVFNYLSETIVIRQR